MFSAYPQYGDYIAACLLQNADFRKKRAEECGLTEQVEELNLIAKETVGRVRNAKHLDKKTKIKFLLEHDSPWLFHIAAKAFGKG